MNTTKIKLIRGYLILLIAFLIPFNPKLLSVVIGISLVLWIAEGDFSIRFKNLQKNYGALFLIAFFLYHAVGLLWSSNMDYGGFDVQVKLSMLVFPLMLLSEPLSGNISLKKIVTIFAAGCLAAFIICFGRSLWYWFSEGHNYFFYKDFSRFVHPGYFSMFLCFAVVVLLQLITDANKNNEISAVCFGAFLVFLLVTGVVLLASKAGIVTLIILLIGASLLAFKWSSGKFTGICLLLLTGALVYFGIFSPDTAGRMSELRETLSDNPNDTIVHTSGMRLQAWKSSLELAGREFPFGTGTGDVKDELVNTYRENGFDAIAKLRLNAHNQFIQTTAALGVPGLILLTGVLISALIFAFRNRNLLLMAFLVVIGLNAMVESILEVSAGVIFFSFLYAALYRKDNFQS